MALQAVKYLNGFALTILSMIFLSPLTFATKIQTEDAIYQGALIDEDASSLFVDTESGVVQVSKSNIVTIDDRPYTALPPTGKSAVSRASVPSQKPSKPSYLGYVPAKDRDLTGKPRPNIGIQFVNIEESKKQLPGTPPKKTIPEPSPFSEDNTIVHASGVTEAELKKYFKENPEEFRVPAQLLLKSMSTKDWYGKPEDEILSTPERVTGWNEVGWAKEGEPLEPFDEEAVQEIFKLRKGQVSVRLKDGYGVEYYFWAVDRKETEIPNYEEIRPKVLNKVLREKTKDYK